MKKSLLFTLFAFSVCITAQSRSLPDTTSSVLALHAQQVVNVYPNPSHNGIFYLKSNNNEAGFERFTITSMDGKMILETTLSEHDKIDCTVNLSDFPSGVYFLTLQGPQGNVTYRLVK